VRIKFPDQTQLEKTFPSTNKIRTIYAFVRSCLTDEVKPIKFILCTSSSNVASSNCSHRFLDQSPPKRDLKVSDPQVRDQTLYDLHLAPSSILLLRFEDESMNRSSSALSPHLSMLTPLTDDQYPAPLYPSILSHATELPIPPPEPSANLERPTPLAPPPPKPNSSTSKGPISKEREEKLKNLLRFGSVYQVLVSMQYTDILPQKSKH